MKTLFLALVIAFSFYKYSCGQIICILCYDQNDSISTGVNNLLVNGSFESNTCNPNYFGSSFCPNSIFYSCDISSWTCTGGGIDTYSCMFTNFFSTIADGLQAAYFGSNYCLACSSTPDDTSCLINVDCTVSGVPAGYPLAGPTYGGATGLSLEQTVTGLIVGNTYVLEFWAGGENYGGYPHKGLFAVDVGFGDTLLRCSPTSAGAIGSVYIIEFIAAYSSQTIKFTNWGHICNDCTELILDNVRLYTLAELSPDVTACAAQTSSFAASDSVVCEKFCTSFFDSSNNNPTSWEWQFPGGNPSSSTDQNPASICYATPGTYDVTLITTNANGSDTLTLPDYITVNPTPPFPAITQVGYTLTSSPASSYQWQLNAADIPGATNQSYTVLQSGTYTVVIGDSNGCVNSASKDVLITGIDVVNGDAGITIYPNPSSGSITIEFSGATVTGDASIEVRNAIGQQVYSIEEKNVNRKFKKEIDLNKFSTGVYIIKLKTSDKFFQQKILITK